MSKTTPLQEPFIQIDYALLNLPVPSLVFYTHGRPEVPPNQKDMTNQAITTMIHTTQKMDSHQETPTASYKKFCCNGVVIIFIKKVN